MNYVESFNLFGTEAAQIPCIKGSGAPTTLTPGAVGCLYMDTAKGDIYKCINVSEGQYTWESFTSGSSIELEERIDNLESDMGDVSAALDGIIATQEYWMTGGIIPTSVGGDST